VAGRVREQRGAGARYKKRETYRRSITLAAFGLAATRATRLLNNAKDTAEDWVEDTEQSTAALVAAHLLLAFTTACAASARRHCRNGKSHGEDGEDDGLLHLEVE
jgi:hypothetical protein